MSGYRSQRSMRLNASAGRTQSNVHISNQTVNPPTDGGAADNWRLHPRTRNRIGERVRCNSHHTTAIVPRTRVERHPLVCSFLVLLVLYMHPLDIILPRQLLEANLHGQALALQVPIAQHKAPRPFLVHMENATLQSQNLLDHHGHDNSQTILIGSRGLALHPQYRATNTRPMRTSTKLIHPHCRKYLLNTATVVAWCQTLNWRCSIHAAGARLPHDHQSLQC